MPDSNVVRVYNPANVLWGGAKPYYGLYNSGSPLALPANTVALNGGWPAGWTEIGGTINGMEFDFDRKTKAIEIDETPTPLGYVTDSSQFMFSIELAEDTFESWVLAYGGGVITTTAAASGVPGTRSLAMATEMTQFAFGFEAKNNYGFWRRLLIQPVVSDGKLKTIYNRATKQRTYKIQLTSLVDISGVTAREMSAVALP